MKDVQRLKREKTVTRAVHKLFWRAALRYKYNLAASLLHIPYFFILHVYLPLEIAYGLEAIVSKHFDQVSIHVTHLLVATILSTILITLGNGSFNRFQVKSSSFVQRLAFESYISKDYEFFANNYVGALGNYAARLREATTKYYLIIYFDIIKIATIVVAGLIVLFIKSPTLAFVTICCVLLVLGSTIATQRFRLKYRRLTSESDGEIAGILGDALSHGTVVKSFGNENYESAILDKSLAKWRRLQRITWDLSIPAGVIRNIMLAGTMSLLLIVSANLYKQQKISFAIIALVQLYVLKLVTAALDISEVVKEFDAAMGAAYQPVATMIETTLIHDPVAQKIPARTDTITLSISDATFGYDVQMPSQKAIKDLSLAIAAGEKIGLVGYSGSGKTTLSKLILRFMDVNSGSICLNDIDVRDFDQNVLRKLISYVPQEPLLFHRSIYENISYGKPNASKKEVLDAARLAYVNEFADTLSDGYGTMVGERGVKLSGGQRQRVAIARAILKNAPLLVLDEATSALDSKSEQFIQKALWKLMEKRTALVIAHRLSTIQRMDRIVVMDKGKIVQIGTHNQLRQRPGIYKNLWEHQSGGYLGGTLSSV